jgi:hypothetical protein
MVPRGPKFGRAVPEISSSLFKAGDSRISEQPPPRKHSWGRRARRQSWQVDRRTREVFGVRTCSHRPQKIAKVTKRHFWGLDNPARGPCNFLRNLYVTTLCEGLARGWLRRARARVDSVGPRGQRAQSDQCMHAVCKRTAIHWLHEPSPRLYDQMGPYLCRRPCSSQYGWQGRT